MTRFSRIIQRLRAFDREEGGQVLPVVCLCFMGMLALTAFAIEWGHASYATRELQATTDASALAAARAVPTASTNAAITGSNGVAALYSSAPGGKNVRPGLPNVTVSSTVLCLNTLKAEGIACTGNVPDNAVQVTQTMALPTVMGAIVGVKTLNISTVATASTRGGLPRPSNIAIIMDTTLSMNNVDTNCVLNGAAVTQMQCALNGLQILLKAIAPCGNYQTTCTNNLGINNNPLDQVALFTFPNVTIESAYIDSSCTTPIPASSTYGGIAGITIPPMSPWSGVPTATTYSTPDPGVASYITSIDATYQLTPFLSDYRISNAAATLNPNSALAMAAGAVPGCGSMLPSNFDGVYGTYYAGAIYAAQSALTAQQVTNPYAENVIILLSDGDATAVQGTNFSKNVIDKANGGGKYASWSGECGQAIDAANAATAAGTLFYTVAYGSASTGCTSDGNSGSYPNVTPCQTMYDMASAPQYFYSDYNQSGSGSTCYSSQPVTALSDIFAAISADLSEARLIPNSTT